MKCPYCGEKNEDGARRCVTCGRVFDGQGARAAGGLGEGAAGDGGPDSAVAARKASGGTDDLSRPSVHGFACQHCGSTDIFPVSVKGGAGMAVRAGLLGAVGTYVAESLSKSRTDVKPVNYKCKQCRKKTTLSAKEAPFEEILPTPCRVRFVRDMSVLYALTSFIVYLNGVKVGLATRRRPFEFETGVRHNAVFVVNQSGGVFPLLCQFEAEPGGEVELHFNGKFKPPVSKPASMDQGA
jgi:DNA-directed RNA polymerase subunit RPC12/RpoP